MFELLNNTLDDGPELAGDLAYYGYVNSGLLPNGKELASMVGYTQGTDINSNARYFHFGFQGKHLYIASKPFRNYVTWASMNAAGIATGEKTIRIGYSEFAVRLIKGGRGSENDSRTVNSEWTQLIYRVASSGNLTPRWLNLSNTELVVDGSQPGQATLCYESAVEGGTRKVTVRGTMGNGVRTYQWLNDSSTQYRGWRPCLELIKGKAIY